MSQKTQWNMKNLSEVYTTTLKQAQNEASIGLQVKKTLGLDLQVTAKVKKYNADIVEPGKQKL